MSDRRFYVIPVVLTWRQVTNVIGKRRPEYERTVNDPDPQPCGLAPGKIDCRIYGRHENGLQSIHVCQHSNGMCVSPSLNVECDDEYAYYAYRKLIDVVLQR